MSVIVSNSASAGDHISHVKFEKRLLPLINMVLKLFS